MKVDYNDSAPTPTKQPGTLLGATYDTEPTEALKALFGEVETSKYARQSDTLLEATNTLRGKFSGGRLTDETLASLGTVSEAVKGDAPDTAKTTVDGDVQDRVAVKGYGVTPPLKWKEAQVGRREWDNELHDNDPIEWIPELIGRVAKTGGVTVGDPDMPESHDSLYWGCIRLGGITPMNPSTTEAGHAGYIKVDMSAEWDDLGE